MSTLLTSLLDDNAGASNRAWSHQHQVERQQQQQRTNRPPQHLRLEQAEQQQGVEAESVVPSRDQEDDSWAEVVRRKPARQQAAQQQQQAQQQQARASQRRATSGPSALPRGGQAVAGSSNPQRSNQQGPQQQERRPRLDAIEVTPNLGQTWDATYRVIRTDQELSDLKGVLRVGRRPSRNLLVMELTASTDTTTVYSRVKEVCDWSNILCRLVTQTTELRNEDLPITQELTRHFRDGKLSPSEMVAVTEEAVSVR
uniref:Uncharacterized protein n=1 Tax=Anopheles maculatus TaxID=74869 RepID=A0A182T0I8_9DIPT